jgi:hypothetical protein
MRTEVNKEIKLTLSEDEAEWLKGYMQNGLPDEDSGTSFLRERLFTTLKEALSEASN